MKSGEKIKKYNNNNNNINNKGHMYGGVCRWLIYTYIIMLANMENCWGLRFMFSGKKKI